ncbi:MAG: type II toxin-antitoxin system VapC family toxin [Conexibacter sp.]
MPARFDRRRATTVAFDGPSWKPPESVVLDTNVVAEALLEHETEHVACDAVLRHLGVARTLVVFNRLLEMELWEVVFNHALRREASRAGQRHHRFTREGRRGPAAALRRAKQQWAETLDGLVWDCVELHEVADAVPDLMRAYGLQSYDAVHAATLLASGVTDMVTRDAGFAVLLPEDATLHTTRRRLGRTRARRRDACGG